MTATERQHGEDRSGTAADAAMTLDDFDRLYRRYPDPWGYEWRDYERRKYAATLAACLDGVAQPIGRALELGASAGVFSALLAPHCRELVTIDGAPTAVDRARERLADLTHVEVVLGEIPDGLPAGPFDLVVASEILYYLRAPALATTLQKIVDALAPGGRLVAVHWRPPGPERPFSADEVHVLVRRHQGLRAIDARHTDDYLLDVLERA